MPLPDVVLENRYLRYVIDSKGFNKSFTDKATGREYLDIEVPNPFMTVVKDGRSHNSSRVELEGDELRVSFDGVDVHCSLKVKLYEDYITFKLSSISDQDIDELTLSRINLTIDENVGRLLNIGWNDEFAACILALNLQVRSYGASDDRAILIAKCYPKYGLLNSRIAIIGVPVSIVRETIRRVQLNEGLPSPTLSGVWDKVSPEVKKSYLFIDVTEQNVDEVIEYAKRGGFGYIMMYNFTWSTSCGSYPIHPKNYPNGLDGMRRVVEKIHKAGLKAGLHFLTTCISKDDPYATPTPDKRLLKDASFTLAEAIDPESTFIPTVEPPRGVPTKPKPYYVGGGNEIQIDDEIIIYEGISLEPPYGFTGCTRGARGTKPARHQRGAKIHHLAEIFGFYIADAESTLLDEIAERIAKIVNECGFDMVYLDGAEAASLQGAWWYYIPKVQLAFTSRFKREVLVQGASYTVSIYRGQGTMLEWRDEQLDHFNWHIYSRDAQTDRVRRGVKGHVDKVKIPGVLKVKANLMPAEFGWFGIFTKTSSYPATEPEEIEYLCNKCVGYDSPLSIETTIRTLRENGWTPRMLSIIKDYETLRLGGYFSERDRMRLRQPRAEFRLTRLAGDRWTFRPVKHHEHYVRDVDGVSNRWTFRNEFKSPSFELRVCALPSPAGYEDDENITLIDLSEPGELSFSSAEGVSCRVVGSLGELRSGMSFGRVEASSSLSDDTGWCQIERVVDLDLSSHRGIGFWIYGDGKGEILNVQFRCLDGLLELLCDHYVVIDFKGWRYVEMLEPEGDRVFDFFKYTRDYYSLATHSFDYSKVNSVALRLMRMPPNDRVNLYITSIKALKERTLPLEGPSITINDRTLKFDVKLEPDQYLIYSKEDGSCRAYSANGFHIKDVEFDGDVPEIREGLNDVIFDCVKSRNSSRKAKVKITLVGRPGE